MWRLLSVMILVPSLLKADWTATSPVLDPSFENQTLTTVSPPWNPVGEGAVIDGGPDAKHGARYLRLGSAKGGWTAVTQKVKIEPRARHILRAAIKSPGNAADVRLQILTETGELVFEKRAAASRDWSEIVLEFSTADEKYINFAIGLMGAPSEFVLVDGVQLSNSKVGMRRNWVYAGGSYFIDGVNVTETQGGKVTNEFSVVDRNPEFVEIAQRGVGMRTRIRLYSDYMTLNKGGIEFVRFRDGNWDDRTAWFYNAPTFKGFFILKPGNRLIEQQTNGKSWEFEETVRNREEVIFKNVDRNVELKITERESFLRTGNGAWEKLWDGEWNSITWGAY